jgi:hypothetical protein
MARNRSKYYLGYVEKDYEKRSPRPKGLHKTGDIPREEKDPYEKGC